MKGMNFSNFNLSRNSGQLTVHLDSKNNICGNIYFHMSFKRIGTLNYENTFKCTGCDLYCWQSELNMFPTTNLLYTNSPTSIDFNRTALLNRNDCRDNHKSSGRLSLNLRYDKP